MKPPEEIKAELVGQWISKAEADLGLAEKLLADQAPYFDAIAFHAQQAAEKFLKALLVRHQIEFSKTHSIGLLLDLVSGKDPSLACSLTEATELTPYGVEPRYPSHLPPISTDEAKRAVDLARKVKEAVRAALGDALE